jgi:cyclase
LLVQNKGLVKTVQFGDSKYVGDPLNAVRIFNEKEVDELIVLDIDATAHGREPNYELVRNLASECRMPLCYGGGITSVEHVQKLVSLGVEKVALSAAALDTPELITDIAQQVGSQSVVVVIDVKKKGLLGKYTIYTHNGARKSASSLSDFVREIEERGAGEVVVNSIDRDGMMDGYDTNLVAKIRQLTSLPITILGGAGSLADISGLYRKFGILGAAVGSLFVFKGVYKAVLINYPNRQEKLKLFTDAGETGEMQ